MIGLSVALGKWRGPTDYFHYRTWSNPLTRSVTTNYSRERTINRYYDPSTDQFLSIDPDVAKTNQPYVFTNDNPLNATDPLGLAGVGVFIQKQMCGKKGCHGGDLFNLIASAAKATVHIVMKYRTTIAGVATLVVCTASGLVVCGVVAAGALAVRVQSRIEKQGFRNSLGANLSDAIVIVGTFGLMRLPMAQVDQGGFSIVQRLLISGTISAPSLLNTFWQFSTSH